MNRVRLATPTLCIRTLHGQELLCRGIVRAPQRLPLFMLTLLSDESAGSEGSECDQASSLAETEAICDALKDEVQSVV